MAEKRKTKRALQAEETKNRIVQATMHLMEKKGFNNITIGEIFTIILLTKRMYFLSCIEKQMNFLSKLLKNTSIQRSYLPRKWL
jgi:hypothetical protein